MNVNVKVLNIGKIGLFALAVCFLSGMGMKAVAQNTQVSGKVVDAQTGKPMIGVSILVVGSTTGTATRSAGQYSLKVSSMQDTLRFSFIGYNLKSARG